MKNVRLMLSVAAFTLLAVQPSFARRPKPTPSPSPTVVPEIDPSLATGALALVGGGLMVFRRGRIKA